MKRNIVIDGTGPDGNFVSGEGVAPFVLFDVDLQTNISPLFGTKEQAEFALGLHQRGDGVYFLGETVYEFYLEAYRLGEMHKETGGNLILCVPQNVMAAPSRARRDIMAVLADAHDAGYHGSTPLTWKQFDMHVLDYINY